MSQRKYVTLRTEGDGQWQIHYRETGAGVPVVLLHPSPLSSGFMEPLISLFAKQARAIAVDTPGYGQSDPLPDQDEGKGEGLVPYVEALQEFVIALELDRPLIYGSATGAQIAIEYGKAYPDSTRGIVLENAAWFFESEREAMMEPYFPDISPRSDGSHLMLIWKMASQVYRYFPWYDTSATAEVKDVGAPLPVVQKTVLDYLIAGPDYDQAYRAALANENPDQLQALRVPTRILRWQDSAIKTYCDRLDNVELPANIEMRYADTGVEARFSALEKILNELL